MSTAHHMLPKQCGKGEGAEAKDPANPSAGGAEKIRGAVASDAESYPDIVFSGLRFALSYFYLGRH